MHFVEAKNILTSANNGTNIYRGCTHGCIYCDTRSRCYGFTHILEDVEVKINAPELLERALRSKRKKCMIGTGSMCDPYQPCEKKLGLTRKCLEIIYSLGFGAAVLTKSNLLLRDIDLLDKINQQEKCVVQTTLTCMDDKLSKIIEPNVCTTRERIEMLHALKERNIPTVVWLCPVLPYITDTRENIEGILNACIETGVKGIISFGIGMTLRDGDREYYYKALDAHFPGLKQRYIREYGNSYNVASPNQPELMELVIEKCAANGIMYEAEECFRYMRELPQKYEQVTLFE